MGYRKCSNRPPRRLFNVSCPSAGAGDVQKGDALFVITVISYTKLLSANISPQFINSRFDPVHLIYAFTSFRDIVKDTVFINSTLMSVSLFEFDIEQDAISIPSLIKKETE